MSDEPQKSSALSAIILAIVLIAVALYSITYGLQTLQWIDGHRMAGANPWLNETPKAIQVNPADAPLAPLPPPPSAKGKAQPPPKNPTISSYGFEYTLPWTGKFTQTPSPNGDVIRFESGQVVVFADPESQLNNLVLLRQSTDPAFASFRNLISAENIGTNYDLVNAVYSVAPSQFSPMMPYATAERARLLLLTKLSFGFDLSKDIYSFTLGNNKGFQFGDPAKGPVAVRVFDPHDNQFRMIFGVFTGTTGQITQDDINKTIASLQPVPIGGR